MMYFSLHEITYGGSFESLLIRRFEFTFDKTEEVEEDADESDDDGVQQGTRTRGGNVDFERGGDIKETAETEEEEEGEL